MVERLPEEQSVRGSIPRRDTSGGVAQRLVQRLHKALVGGPNPPSATCLTSTEKICYNTRTMKTNKTKKTVAGRKASQPKPAKATPTLKKGTCGIPKKRSFGYFDYDHIARCIDKVRDIICDVSNGGLQKHTKLTLLHDALATLDIVKTAFCDSRADLQQIKFKIYS